ncbi:hypothetical protein FEE95_17480 [Maribacter algarum]|uniref:DUF4412 domain-containing protein n=1 Tax=Maribacter algarum (ex Zhang et al. 2020) TaxID=2578118 RepID=A0A5S3PJN7_9FLAO|nr:DUF6263 family protein [Maribacter algarum]TMM53691.1 hypothetical protein FEE95_17480 [Maribacter algarum]
MKQAIILLCFVLSTLSLPAQTTLGYHLNTGDTLMVKQHAQQTIVQELDGATHELTNDMNGILEFIVLAEKDSTYEISLAFKDLNLLMNSSIQGQLMEVKAKEVSENDVQSQIFNSLLNNPVNLTLAKTGDILEVIGGDSLVTKMANASGLEDEFSKNMMKKGLEKEFGSEALSNSYKQLTYIYSDRTVTIGDSWQNEYQGKLNAKNTWTLEAIDETNATISGSATVLMETNESGTVMNLEGTQTTKILTDVLSGFILKMTVDGKAEGSSTMAQLGDQKIPTSITSKITYELIKD